MTTIDFQEIFDAVQTDPAAKKAFLAMSREEQFLAMLGMMAWQRTEIARQGKDLVEIKHDVDAIKRKQASGGSNDRSLTTTEKINATINNRFKFWAPILQNIVQTVLTIVVLWILYSTFGAKP